MAIKPILFNTEMVRAIRDGRKTQTRRIIKLTPGFSGRQVGESGNPDNPLGFIYPCGIKRPPCNKGDILWVRETWYKDAGRYMYRANYTKDDKFYHNGKEVGISWRPSIHMPKEAARTFLLVKDVRCERLQDITETQALMEGCYMYRTPGKPKPGNDGTAVEDFQRVWESTIKPADRDIYGWDANPWVWVIEFKQCARPDGW